MKYNYLFNKIGKFSRKCPDKLALITDQDEITYIQLEENIDNIAAHFTQLVKPKKTIALQLPNCVELVYAYFACFCEPVSILSTVCK